MLRAVIMIALCLPYFAFGGGLEKEETLRLRQVCGKFRGASDLIQFENRSADSVWFQIQLKNQGKKWAQLEFVDAPHRSSFLQEASSLLRSFEKKSELANAHVCFDLREPAEWEEGKALWLLPELKTLKRDPERLSNEESSSDKR